MNEPDKKLNSKEFIILNIMFFVVSAAMALFFQFHLYLASLRVDPHWIGFIIGADALISFFVQPLLIPFLHSRNARKWMCIGLSVMMAALFLYRWALTVPTLVAVRMLQGAGFICSFSAMTVLIVDYIPIEKSGRAFGLLSLTRLLPYALVPPVVGFLSNFRGGFVGVLTCCALWVAFSFPLSLWLKPLPTTAGSEKTKGYVPLWREMIKGMKNRNVILLLLMNLLIYSGYTVVFFFVKGYAGMIGVKYPGIFFTIVTMAMIGIRLLSGAFLDKINKVSCVLWSLVALVAGYLLLACTGSEVLFYVVACILGLAWGIVMPLLNAIMFDVSSPPFRGRNLNLSMVLVQGSFFMGPFVGGLILSGAGYAILFCLCAGLGVVTMIMTKCISSGPADDGGAGDR